MSLDTVDTKTLLVITLITSKLTIAENYWDVTEIKIGSKNTLVYRRCADGRMYFSANLNKPSARGNGVYEIFTLKDRDKEGEEVPAWKTRYIEELKQLLLKFAVDDLAGEIHELVKQTNKLCIKSNKIKRLTKSLEKQTKEKDVNAK